MKRLKKFDRTNELKNHLAKGSNHIYYILEAMGHVMIVNSEHEGYYNIVRSPYLKIAKSKEIFNCSINTVLTEINKALRTFRDHARGVENYKETLKNSINYNHLNTHIRKTFVNDNVMAEEFATMSCEHYGLDWDAYTDTFGNIKEAEAVETEAEAENDKFEEIPEPSADTLDVKVDHTLSIENMISKVIRDSVKSEYTSEMITHVLHKKLNEYGIKPKVKNHVLKRYEDGGTIDLGDAVHKDFWKVLKYAECRMNVFLTGPSGSGKTHCAYEVGKALGLKVYSKSVGIETGMHEFMGWLNVDGKAIETDFEKAYKNGGIFLVDEIDGGNPNVLLALNQALGNTVCTFASGIHKKHTDFICIAGANTWGFGATPDYVGRNPIDGATLNRFVFVEYGYDEDLEIKLSKNEAWAKKVQRIRVNAKNNRVKHIISPRASIMGAKLLSYGIDEKTVLKDVVYQGLSEEEINLIKD